MATLESLQAKIAKLRAQAEAIAKKESSTVIAKIRDIMERHGLTTADIEAHIGGGKKRGRKPGVKLVAKSAASATGKLPPKYRDPKTGATWSGHARPPQWIAGVKDRNKFLIGSSSAGSVPAAKKQAAKSGAYVRGPQPAKYRNPETGATWSGRGPAPSWLASVKDRTKFLITGAGESKAEPTATAGKKAAPGKKTAAKKAATKKAMGSKGAVKKAEPVAKKAPAKKAAAKTAVVKKAAKKSVSKKASVSTVPGSIAPSTAPETASVTALA